MNRKITKEEFLKDKLDKWYKFLLPLLPEKDYLLQLEDLLDKLKDLLC